MARGLLGHRVPTRSNSTRPLADGTYAIHALATDAAGNVSPSGPAFSLTIDATPPAAPSIPGLLAADDSGALGDGITKVNQPRLTGSAEANSSVQLIDGLGHVDGSGVVSGTGSYTIKLNAALIDGTFAIHALATDAAGNIGPAGPAFTLTIDTTPPAAPSMPSLLAADDSGTVGDGITDVKQPRLTGSAEANSSVQLIDGLGHVDGSGVVSGTGSYTIKLNAALIDGTYAIHAVATDAAGNVSPSGPAFSLTILTTSPATPSAPSLLALDDSGTAGDGITNVKQPRLTGSATAGLTVRLVNLSNVIMGTATASGTGSVTISPSAPLADGTYVLDFVAVDAAGNVSVASGTFSLTILTTPPPQPAAPTLLAADDTGVAGDGMTTVRRPRLVGTAVPGGRIDWLGANGSVLASTTASASNGSYQLQLPSASVNGTYSVTVRETDVAGNVSLTSTAFSLDHPGRPRRLLRRRPDGYLRLPHQRCLLLHPEADHRRPRLAAVRRAGRRADQRRLLRQRPQRHRRSTGRATRPSSPTTRSPWPSNPCNSARSATSPSRATTTATARPTSRSSVPGTATFMVQMSATNTTYTHQFGGAGDIPVPADYFGNGHADLAFYGRATRPFTSSTRSPGVSRSSPSARRIRLPVPADYEGLGHVDPAVYQPEHHHVRHPDVGDEHDL